MSEQTSLIPKPTDAVENGTLINLIQDVVPRLQKTAANILSETKKIPAVTEANFDEVRALVIPIRDAHVKMVNLRKGPTELMDQLKQFMMESEKQVNDEMERLRAGIGKVEQEKIARNKEIEEKARIQKLKEQALADLTASIKLKVTDVIINRCRALDTESQKFFGQIKDMADFEERATKYKTTKWRLREAEYNECFVVPYNGSIISTTEMGDVVTKLKDDMSYEKINAMFLEKAEPILTTWKSKIPQLREEWKDKFFAGEEERKRLDAESESRNEAERKRQEEILLDTQRSMQASVQSEQVMTKVESEFKEQATTQSMEKTGPKKKVVKFKNYKNAVAPLCEIIFHCAMHPKFPGFAQVTKDKDKSVILDDQGRVEYVPAVDWFLEFFAKNCDASIKEIEIFEDAKVIIRK